MKHQLKVSYRKGKPLAAYLYLTDDPGAKSVRVEEASPGLLIDFAGSGEPIGVEITSPSRATAAQINAVLRGLGQDPISEDDIAPLVFQSSGQTHRE